MRMSSKQDYYETKKNTQPKLYPKWTSEMNNAKPLPFFEVV